MMKIGQYVVTATSEEFRIFPKNKHGKTIPVRRVNNFLELQHVPTGLMVSFKRYLHQRRWHWRDSRDQNSTTEWMIVKEVARMLFGGDENKAGELLFAVVTGQDIENLSLAL